MTLRLVFMGTPDFSVPTLRALHEAGHEIAAVYTQPPRPAGRRGLETVPSPVEQEARRLGLSVRSPVSLKGAEEQAAFAALQADVAVVVAYGLLLPKAILEAPRFGALNGHGSLLPRWRGAAPIQRAIEAGDTVTGMMVMGMEAGLDTGPVALTEEVAIGPTDTAREVHDRLSAASAALMVEAMTRLEDGSLRFETQDAIAARTGREVKYAAKIEKGEAAVDWSRPAAEIARRINAFSPFPGAWTVLGGERLKLLRAAAEEGAGEAGTALDDTLLVAAGEGAVRLIEVQKAGGKASDAAGLLRGAKVPAGTRFGA
ncbi:methionyl-tRNA formyltransferase [Aureimonas phyllosphaerae]|uniref:Methionyl-tRNA formyltransferase n=1 Tax=Aureimonas phyllosphaerae TaxID=1166078 RepID=A0A7W6BQ73_9HYPH|nr:methionyl-tRNA formyltransferase [Aureimonas phyllosphaerae]MBB3936064.1 methionyl-tRNA formyltransferase [Aureimonas phyllosphaerae]MBB3960211.1 methionyl-tRNA formyltransferase [Aureimonas phyllosphaerae]SFF35184.1 methionyl-tRNA formyltransferase [Aureimonas phyllosphaerae]